MKRLWALLALVAAGAAGAALVMLVVRNLIAFAIVFASVVLAAAAGWLALTRHGARRVVAAGAGLTALVAGAAAFVERGAIDELVVFAVAAAAFAFLSHRALAPPRHPSAAPRRPTSRLFRESRGILLLNPKSGGGKVERFDLVAEARARGVETIVLQPGDDLRELAVAAAARRPSALGVAGGDGSQALVAQLAAEHALPFVCVPAGTRNHLALDLGLDIKDPSASLEAFVDGTTAEIDLAYVNDRVFVNNTSVGVYADIVQSREYRHAKLMTTLDAIPNLVGPKAERTALTFEAANGIVRHSRQLLLVSNNPYELRRPLAVGTRPALDTGHLGIAALEVTGTLAAAEVATLELLGRSSSFAGFTQWTAQTFEVWGDAPIVAAIDGEAVTLEERLCFRIAPSALTIVLPPDVQLRRQARRQATTAKLGTLGRVALGRGGTPPVRR